MYYLCRRLRTSDDEGGQAVPLLFMIMIDKELIKNLVAEKLKGTDYFLVNLFVSQDNLIAVEIDRDSGVNIDDCVALNRYIEESLDREKEDFELEVGSSGITSPFKIVRQYIKNIGNEVEMLLKSGIKLTGILKAADDQGATITVEKKIKSGNARQRTTVEEDRTYSYDEIKYTKYLIRF
jgi:ribosome maturation factor RimP